MHSISTHTFRSLATLIAWLTIAFAFAVPAIGQAPKKITFDDDVRPLFERRCSVCHNSDRREGDLDLTNFVNLMQGGGSGTVLESEDPSGSYLYGLVTHAESPEMPPGGSKIPQPEIDLIAAWINGGLLENTGSKAAKAKPKVNLVLEAAPNTRPDVAPTPYRMSLEPIITPPVGSVIALAANPWAPVIAVSTPRQILLYRSDRLELAGVLPNDTGVAQSLTFSRNGELLLASGGRGGESGSVLMFNARTGDLLNRLAQGRDSILTADLSADQSLIAIGGTNKRVAVITSAGEPVHDLKRHTDWVTAVGFSPDGQFLATADRNGGLLLWETDSGVFVQKLDGHGAAITSLGWRSDSRLFATSGEDGTVRLWNTQNPTPVKSWIAHVKGALSVGFRRDGSIFSAGRDHLVKLWQADGKVNRVFKGLQDIAVAVAVCDETNRVFAADWTGNLIAWDANDETVLKLLPPNPPTLQQRFSTAKAKLGKAQTKANSTATAIQTIQNKIDTSRANRKACENEIAQTKPSLAALDRSRADQIRQRQRASLTNLRRFQNLAAEQNQLTKLNAALEQSKLALANLPNDQLLLKTVAYLKFEIQWRDDRIEEFVPFAFANFREHVRASWQLQDLQRQATSIEKKRSEKTLQVNELNKRLNNLNAQFKQQAKVNATAAAEVAAKQKAVSRWQNEIQFDHQLRLIRNQLAASEEQLVAKQEAVKRAQQERKEADQKVDRAKQSTNQSRASVEATRKQLQKLRQPNL